MSHLPIQGSISDNTNNLLESRAMGVDLAKNRIILSGNSGEESLNLWYVRLLFHVHNQLVSSLSSRAEFGSKVTDFLFLT